VAGVEGVRQRAKGLELPADDLGRADHLEEGRVLGLDLEQSDEPPVLGLLVAGHARPSPLEVDQHRLGSEPRHARQLGDLGRTERRQRELAAPAVDVRVQAAGIATERAEVALGARVASDEEVRVAEHRRRLLDPARRRGPVELLGRGQRVRRRRAGGGRGALRSREVLRRDAVPLGGRGVPADLAPDRLDLVRGPELELAAAAVVAGQAADEGEPGQGERRAAKGSECHGRKSRVSAAPLPTRAPARAGTPPTAGAGWLFAPAFRTMPAFPRRGGPGP
jgi:hypothetical protein